MSASPKRRHRPVLGLPGSRNLRYSPVTALTALDSRIGTPSLPLSFPRTLAYRCCMLLCFCFSNEFFFCPARVNCDTVSQGRGNASLGSSIMKSYRKELWFNTSTPVALVNITAQVQDCLRQSGVKEGLVL